ncbi:MAG: hypothetical protein KJ655_05750 [Candidatus Thermoplasmatota archaeon]|nr:hypothetical protein [Candidatus Thermoplasmatota archaeon]
MKKATFTFELDEKTSEIVAKSLLPESKRIVPRTKVEIKNNKGKLVLNIMADDVSALRAGINSYLRWIKTAVDMSNIKRSPFCPEEQSVRTQEVI